MTKEVRAQAQSWTGVIGPLSFNSYVALKKSLNPPASVSSMANEDNKLLQKHHNN